MVPESICHFACTFSPSSERQKKLSNRLAASRSRVHSGIRVHLTLRGPISLYIYHIGSNCTPNAFFFHPEDGKNICIWLLNFGGGKLATPPPLATVDRFRNKGHRRFFFVVARFCGQALDKNTWKMSICMKACDEGMIFSKKTTMERGQNEFCPGTISRRRTRSGRSQYLCILWDPPPPPRKGLTLIPEWPLFRNAL